MSTLARLRTATAPHEVCEAYDECLREYRSNIREAWLVQESSRIVKRINIIRAKLVFAREEQLCAAWLRRELRKQQSLLAECRAELLGMRGES